MIVHKDSSRTMRCCGPRGCGVIPTVDENFTDPGQVCTGPRCMAWRVVRENTDYGYCGLAGEPQCGITPS